MRSLGENKPTGVHAFLAAALALACAGMLTNAAAAIGAPTISINVGPDPVESITTQLGASGTDPSSSNTFVLKAKPTGGEACGANPSADKGDTVLSEFSSSGEGAHSASANWTFRNAGSYLLCAWLIDTASSEETIVATASTVVAVRAPHLSVSIVAPSRARPQQTFQIATTAQAETSRELTQYVIPNTSRGCPANSQAAESTTGHIETNWPTHFGGWSVDGGPFSESLNMSITSPGSYLVCAYFEYPSSESVPEATASATILIANPPPPCVVPHVQHATTLRSFEHRLGTAHCRLGKVTYTWSSHVTRGDVLAVSPAAGSKHANGSAVNLLVSKGRRHRHR